MSLGSKSKSEVTNFQRKERLCLYHSVTFGFVSPGSGFLSKERKIKIYSSGLELPVQKYLWASQCTDEFWPTWLCEGP